MADSNHNTQTRPFLYLNSTMIGLNSLIAPGSGWTLYFSTGINDSGLIVRYGVSGQSQHAPCVVAMPDYPYVAFAKGDIMKHGGDGLDNSGK